MEENDLAKARVQRLALRDPLACSMGFECVDAGTGYAAVRLRVKEPHLNFNGTCHGGVVFALADTAFGLASNSQGVIAAGIDAHITYQVSVFAGDVLTATATQISRSRRIGVYLVQVTKPDGVVTSAFTGTVYVTERPNE